VVIPLYFGFDEREEIGSHVFCSSVIHHASRPVSLIPLHLPLFRSFYAPGLRDGTNAFIYTRFLIPFLQGFRGWAIFADGADMICKTDIAQLWALRDEYKAVMVAPHDYKTKHARKYVGTKMEADNRDYPRKNQSSLMLVNCAHFAWRQMNPETVTAMSGEDLHRFSWIPDDQIGLLPLEWNWIVDEYGANKDAHLLHWTAGIPGFPHYANAPHAADWAHAATKITHKTE
jgi:lipopolysaccharide biosynthesis glycosyltransferase